MRALDWMILQCHAIRDSVFLTSSTSTTFGAILCYFSPFKWIKQVAQELYRMHAVFLWDSGLKRSLRAKNWNPETFYWGTTFPTDSKRGQNPKARKAWVVKPAIWPSWHLTSGQRTNWGVLLYPPAAGAEKVACLMQLLGGVGKIRVRLHSAFAPSLHGLILTLLPSCWRSHKCWHTVIHTAGGQWWKILYSRDRDGKGAAGGMRRRSMALLLQH